MSCGCLISKGEEKIIQLLNNANILYTTQQKFETCKLSSQQNSYAKFDFYINSEYLVEYDGEQHFIPSSNGWNTKEKLKLTQERDNYKNQWCKENNIPLIRIPYIHFKDLCLEDLLLDTTTFLI